MALSTSRNRSAAFHALDKRHQPVLVRRLHRFFIGQARRVVERYLAEYAVLGRVGEGSAAVVVSDSKRAVPQVSTLSLDQPATQPPQAEELLPTPEREALWQAVLPFILQVILNAAELAGSMVGLGALEVTDPRVQRSLADARLHLAGVHDTTLAAIRTMLAVGFQRGYTPLQIAYGVQGAGYIGLAHIVAETYVNRSRLIGSTEIAVARQNTALERYQQAGVAMALITDGMDCGLEDHDDSTKANGMMLSLIQASKYPISHPGCARIFLPVK